MHSKGANVIASFQTISEAVDQARPGDTITVHSGTYREWINPLRGGTDENSRVVYRAAPGEHVEIKGSEVIKNWEKVQDGVWKVRIPNSFFGNYNPYKDSVNGDWFHRLGRVHHTGEVFLNGKSLYEKEAIEKVYNPVVFENSKDHEGSLYTWYCESGEKITTIWANFHKHNPNKELVEISVRRTCFYPDQEGINYITISGFYFSQAATQWAAPTAEQTGMISTHWNKGWIIENNVISDSKCNGITLGKERKTGHNVWSADEGNMNRDGNIHYIEVVFNVLRNHWDKEHIGSHIVRNNEIFNCEQTAICGSMGAVFSTIENNHIHDIWTKRQFSGFEIAGIKLHAAVDTRLIHNRIHHTGRGIWLDWMTQGTRVSRNLLYDNDLEDLFIEVSHGPYLVDNNFLLSAQSLRNWSQGGAFVQNLFAGKIKIYVDPNRFTPYFLPHSLDMAGLTTISGGDDRFFNNIFIGAGKSESSEDYGLEAYNQAFLPVFMRGNVYYNNAKPSRFDSNYLLNYDFDPQLTLRKDKQEVYINFRTDPSFTDHRVSIISSEILGSARIPKAEFDNPNGEPLIIDIAYSGEKREEGNVFAGPVKNVKEEENSLKLW